MVVSKYSKWNAVTNFETTPHVRPQVIVADFFGTAEFKASKLQSFTVHKVLIIYIGAAPPGSTPRNVPSTRSGLIPQV